MIIKVNKKFSATNVYNWLDRNDLDYLLAGCNTVDFQSYLDNKFAIKFNFKEIYPDGIDKKIIEGQEGLMCVYFYQTCYTPYFTTFLLDFYEYDYKST